MPNPFRSFKSDDRIVQAENLAATCLLLAESLAAKVPADQLTEEDRAGIAKLPALRAKLPAAFARMAKQVERP
jgi:hypothetical protein